MDRIQLRRDSSARWAEVNPVLLEGEVGFETDTRLRKIGDGVHAWNDLDYLAAESIVQELGDSENVVISQKGVTDKFTELESEGNVIVGLLEKSPDISLEKVVASNYINDKYISTNGSLIDYKGFRIVVCSVHEGWYALTGAKFGYAHPNYVFSNNANLAEIHTIVEEDKNTNSELMIYVPNGVQYIAWSEYPQESSTMRELYDCSKGVTLNINPYEIIGEHVGEIPLVDSEKRVIINGEVVSTQYDLRVSEMMEVRYGQIIIVKPDNIHWATTCGYRFLAEDGSSVISYGVINSASSEFTLDVPTGALYFQLSESKDLMEQSIISYYQYNTINGVKDELTKTQKKIEKKYVSIVYQGGNLPTTKYIYQGEVHDDVNYGLYTSTLIDVEYSSKLKLVCKGYVFEGVCGWRFLNKENEVISFGANIGGVNEFELVVPEEAKYFQFSDKRDALLNTTIYADCLSKDNQYNLIKNYEQKAYGVSFGSQNVSIPSKNTVEVVGGKVCCRDWISAISITRGASAVDITLTFGVLFGKSSLRITEQNLVETQISHGLTKYHSHGLVLGDTIHMIVTVKNDHAKVLLMSNGKQFETELEYFYGTNGLFILNNSNDTIVVNRSTIDLTATANANVIVCGDSYAFEGYGVNENLPKYGWTSLLKKMGCEFGNVSFPGGKSGEIFDMLNVLCATGAKPSVIVWALGMNDSTSYWKRYIDNACALANSIGAIFIPCTIPSVPDLNHDDKNDYIRSGVFERYLDFDDALTGKTPHASDGRNWFPNYLSSDNVHPSPNGFFAMATQAILDVPEFFKL